MLSFDKDHDPAKNAQLLQEIRKTDDPVSVAVQETDQLFQQCLGNLKQPQNNSLVETSHFFNKIQILLGRIFSKSKKFLRPTKILVDSEGIVFPEWKEKLDAEYTRLLNHITKEINLADYGAVGDGKTDCTAAFKQAVGNGRVKVIVPAGVFITKGIQLPSWTFLVGAGKANTTIKLHDQADKGTRLVTNLNHWKGNHHLFVQGLSLDWNVERLGDAEKTSTTGNHSSCLTYANVTYGWVKDVEAINPGLHGFDISSTLYNYSGDGRRARRGSRYVWLDHLNGHGFGDDGITTHHSDFIFITNSHMCDPSGRAHQKGFSNSNGIEVDDGSRNVLLVNNSTARCFGGIEIKAHENSSAASNVQIVGHISVNDNRSYNFRHIGHHKSTDSESKTAFNITATNIAAIRPIFSDLYLDSTPRGLVVSAYKNVVINHFTLMGDPEYDYQHNPVIAIQYRARNVVLKDISIEDFTKAGPSIKIYGGENRADEIQIIELHSKNSGAKQVEIGLGVKNIKVDRQK